MPNPKYTTLENEVASAIIIWQRHRNGQASSAPPGTQEERQARDKARLLIKAIATHLMHRSPKNAPNITEADVDRMIDPYRNALCVIDMQRLVDELRQKSAQVYIWQSGQGLPHAERVKQNANRQLDSVAAFRH